MQFSQDLSRSIILSDVCAGRTALQRASYAGWTAGVKLLLDANASVEKADPSGSALL